MENLTQDEKLDWLVNELCQDSKQYKDLKVDKSERRGLMRSLMNIRIPRPMYSEFFDIQDSFLQEEAKEKGIIYTDDIPTIIEAFGSKDVFGDKISLWQGDITRLAVDGIVNAANSQMLGCFVPCHGCIDNAIHSAAGIELRHECYKYMSEKRKENPDYEEPTGSAVVTAAYNLPCRKVIHTVGPIVSGKLTEKLRNDLKNCYESILNAAVANNLRSIAFCCISTGEFHFPNEEAASISVAVVREFLLKNKGRLDRVIFNVFKDYDLEIYRNLLMNDSI